MRFGDLTVRYRVLAVGLLLAGLTVGSGGCALRAGPTQGLGYSMPEGKELKSAAPTEYGNGWSLDRLVYEGTPQEWTEALEVMQIHRRGQPPTVQEFYARLQGTAKARCPDGEWTVVGEDASTLTYERIDPQCSGFPAQQSVNRLLFGDDLIFVMMYTKRGAFSEEERAALHRMLASASVGSPPWESEAP